MKKDEILLNGESYPLKKMECPSGKIYFVTDWLDADGKIGKYRIIVDEKEK